MASISVPFNGFTLSAQRTLGPATVGAGRSTFQIDFDMAGFTAGQAVILSIDVATDGVTFETICQADFTGPWTDKQGVLQTAAFLRFGFGQNPDGSQRVSDVGWKIRGTMTPVNGPVVIGAGTIAAS